MTWPAEVSRAPTLESSTLVTVLVTINSGLYAVPELGLLDTSQGPEARDFVSLQLFPFWVALKPAFLVRPAPFKIANKEEDCISNLVNISKKP